MKKYYCICGQKICVDAPYFPADCSDWRQFESFAAMSDIDINIACTVCDDFPQDCGVEIGSAEDVTVSAQGDIVFRHFKMGNENGAVTCYNHTEGSESKTVFTQKSFKYLMDSRYMWHSLSLPQLLLPHKAVFLHASYIELNGKAILFSAPCGTGKSTQANLWRKYRNAQIINGDKAGVSVVNGNVYANGLPVCGTSGICINRTLPLGAIVLLEQSPQNSARLVQGVEALQGLMQNIYLDLLAPKEQLMCIDLVIEILSKVPIYSFGCTPDENAVITLESSLKNGGVF